MRILNITIINYGLALLYNVADACIKRQCASSGARWLGLRRYSVVFPRL